MNDSSDNRGTVLEPVADLRDALADEALRRPDGTRLEPQPAGSGAQQPTMTAAEAPYRPSIRPLVPRLTLLDDGDPTVGETIRLREEVTLIGRTEGHVRLPHDPLVSARHAEILREGVNRPHRWLLRDLGSSNGTFVRCIRTILRPESLVMLGGRRFRFKAPPTATMPEGQPAGTMAVDLASFHGGQLGQAGSWPTLVETGRSGGGMELVLAGDDLTLGRPGHGNAIEIDDPLLAARHSRIIRNAAGQWLLEALPSLNGVWAQVAAVHLAPICRFQIGEQRFLFVADATRMEVS